MASLVAKSEKTHGTSEGEVQVASPRGLQQHLVIDVDFSDCGMAAIPERTDEDMR